MQLTQACLKEWLTYNEHTGEFTWNKSPSWGIKAGVQAGYQKSGYRQIRLCGELHYGHRLAFLYMTGAMPPSQVDHINGCKSDNSWTNLRSVSPLENRRNAAKSRNNTSGVTGVVWDKNKQKWMARIMVNHKANFLGYFDSVEDAKVCRKAAETRHNFHPNHGRSHA